MYIKSHNHNNNSDNNDSVNTINNYNNNNNNSNNKNKNNNNNNNKSHYEQGEKKSKDIEIKQTKIFKITMTPQHYPLNFLPRFPVLNPPEKQLIILLAHGIIIHLSTVLKLEVNRNILSCRLF